MSSVSDGLTVIDSDVVSGAAGAAFDESAVATRSLSASVDATRRAGVSSCAAITITAPVTHMAARSIVPAPMDHECFLDFFFERFPVVDDFFDAAVVFDRAGFFSGIAGPPSTRWGIRSKGGAR
jgi:hypothetical protein